MPHASKPTFSDLEMGAPAVQEQGFNLNGWAVWDRHRVRVGFRIRLDNRNRLIITRLELDAPNAPGSISTTMLREFPTGELLLVVRDWIVNDGEPAELFAGSAQHRAWSAVRPDVVRTLLTVADGPPPGRKIKRDDDYLRSVATEYVRLAHDDDVRNPRDVLAPKFGVAPTGIATTIRLARQRSWLAPVSGKGARREIAPGPRLLAAWEADGYPDWYKRPSAPTGRKPSTESVAKIATNRKDTSK